MNRFAVVGTVAVLACGCQSSPVNPTPPSGASVPSTAAPPAPASQLNVLSGVVFEVTPAGVMVPIEGIEVEEYHQHQVAATDANGFYHFTAVSGGALNIGFEKQGFQSNRSRVVVNGDTRFDMQAIRR
jgi:hypothetical protein